MFNELELILSEVREYEENHHMERPFLSAYQLALSFAERYPDHEQVRSLPLGGAGTDAPQSLAQYIARYLSRAIKDRNERGEPSSIEGRFISHQDLDAMQFTGNVNVSTLRTKPAHSIFRYIY